MIATLRAESLQKLTLLIFGMTLNVRYRQIAIDLDWRVPSVNNHNNLVHHRWHAARDINIPVRQYTRKTA